MPDLPVFDAQRGTATGPDGGLAFLAAPGAGVEVVEAGQVRLGDPNSVWIVEQGEIDLFAVELLDERSVGARRFLWSAAAPAIVFGLPDAPGDRRFSVLAIGGSGTRMRRLPLQTLRARAGHVEAAHAAMTLVETFVTQASAAIGRTAHPHLDAVCAAGASLELRAGQHAGAERVLWIQHTAGRSLFAGAEGATIGAADGAVPLGAGTWITAADGPAQVSAIDTDAAWRDGLVWPGLARFCDHLAGWTARRSIAMEAAEGLRLARKGQAEKQMLGDSMLNLAGVLGEVERAPSPASDGEPLLAACRTIGARTGIDFQAPPAWEIDRRVRDPLASICRASRVRHRRVALRGEWWRSSSGPLLGFAGEERRPVALLPAGHTRYELVDPGRGERIAVNAAVSGTIDPFAFEFYRRTSDTAITLATLGRMALAEARGDLPRLLWSALAGGLLGLVLPIAIGQIFSHIIPMAVPSTIVPLLVTLVAFSVASAFFDLTRAVALIRIEGRTNSALQSAIIDRLLALPVPFFRAYSTGDLAMRAGAINAVRSLLSGAAMTAVLEGAFSIVNLGLLLYYSGPLTLVAVGALVVALVFTSSFALVTLRLERRRQAAEGVVAGLVFEILGAIAKLRVAGAERRAFAVWGRKFREQRDLAFRAGRYENYVAVFNEVLPVATTLALLGTAGLLVSRGAPLNTGDFVAFNAAFGSFFFAGIQVSQTIINSLNVIPMMERARPILEARLESAAARPDPGHLRGRIEVSHLSFRYKADGPPILHDVSVHAEPGEFVALVGPSGSGKSTLLRLLLGFEVPESGAIYFDEQDLSLVDLTAVRAQMGVVLQTSRLLAGDIFRNIIGSAPLSIDEAWEAAERAGLADDIRAMPMGMFTVLSEGGSTLSGGQRQRLLIARALVHRPRIVLFDEATSALDNRSQAIVSRSLENMKATRIVIAHRLSTIRNAHRIFVMESGRIVQHGSYDELAAAPGLFTRMIARQII